MSDPLTGVPPRVTDDSERPWRLISNESLHNLGAVVLAICALLAAGDSGSGTLPLGLADLLTAATCRDYTRSGFCIPPGVTFSPRSNIARAGEEAGMTDATWKGNRRWLS